LATDPEDLFAGGTQKPNEAVVLAGRYRVIRELGRGGMGTVYLARDEKLDGHEVAIKMPPAMLARNRKAVEQLKKEARRGMRLSHTNVVPLRGFEESDDGVFLVMDYVPGKTLEEHLEEHGPLFEEEIERIFTPIANALDYAHGKQVIHRDVKPSNILLHQDGTPLITDFGIAREMKESLTRLTGKSTSGTLPYMSPEQLNGEAPSPAQDIYSFAATMYECLAGHAPFHRGEIGFQIVNNEPPPLREPPSKLKSAILRGLAKKGEDRPKSCAALVSGEAPLRRAAGRKSRGERGSARSDGSRRRWGMALALLLLLLLGGGIAVLATQDGDDPPPKRETAVGNASKQPPTIPEKPGKSGKSEKSEPPAPPPPPVFQGKLLVTNPAQAMTITGNRKFKVTGRLTDCERGRVFVDGERYRPTSKGNFEVPINLSEGETTIEISAVDGAGARRDPLSFKVILDTTKPVIELDALPQTVKSSSLRVSGKVKEPGCTVTVCDKETPVRNGRFEQTVSFAKDGNYTIEVIATDKAGNSAEVKRTVTRRTVPDLGSGYAYRSETLRAFQTLIASSEWSPGNPLRTGTGTKEMRRATHKRTGLNFVVVPAGSFSMGSTDGDSDEQPVRPVTISRAFLMCETECTQSAWKQVMGSNPSNFSSGNSDRRPVEQVSWDDVKSWLRKAGDQLRLPSEAEWEYACRAGGQTDYCFGQDERQLGEYGWYFLNSGSRQLPSGTEWDGSKVLGEWGCQSHSVGGKKPNAFGLYDMHGNVWEWCEDKWHDSYSGAPRDGTSWLSGGTSFRVARGGSWFGTACHCRSALRLRFTPDFRYLLLGFRPARSLP